MANVVLPLGPAFLDITGVRAGDRNLISLTLTSGGAPLDLTGMTVEAQARPTPLAESVITAVTEVTDAPGGVFTLRWPGDEVRAMLGTKTSWKGVWDLQVQSVGEDPVTMIAGNFSAVMDVTRAATP